MQTIRLNLSDSVYQEVISFLRNFSPSDVQMHLNPKKSSPPENTHWEKIDAALRSADTTNTKGAGEIKAALTLLGEVAKKTGESHHRTARDEYLHSKYMI